MVFASDSIERYTFICLAFFCLSVKPLYLPKQATKQFLPVTIQVSKHTIHLSSIAVEFDKFKRCFNVVRFVVFLIIALLIW